MILNPMTSLDVKVNTDDFTENRLTFFLRVAWTSTLRFLWLMN